MAAVCESRGPHPTTYGCHVWVPTAASILVSCLAIPTTLHSGGMCTIQPLAPGTHSGEQLVSGQMHSLGLAADWRGVRAQSCQEASSAVWWVAALQAACCLVRMTLFQAAISQRPEATALSAGMDPDSLPWTASCLHQMLMGL